MRASLSLLVFLCLSSVAAASDCGDVGQRACTIARASLVGEKPKACPAGTRFDLIDGGSCWQCPAGMARTVFPVNGAQACEVPAGESLVKATLSKPTGAIVKTHCAQGKLDPLAGVCYSCPGGYERTGYAVDSDRACSRSIPARFGAAVKASSLTCPAGSVSDPIDGGTCWSCPPGYGRSWSSVKAADACTTTTFAGLGAGVCRPGVANIRGTCMQIGACGQQGQRPCEIGERVPSCNPGLKESFKANVCEALRPGETPFLGGLASLSAYYGDSIKSVCKSTLGSLNLNDNTQIGIAAECSKMVFVGAGCEYLADALGADKAAAIGQLADTPRQIAESQQKFNEFRGKVDRAYQSPECRQFAETLAPATLHGPSSGTRCADGQFWDPNGSCYSCPAGFTRTLEPVTSARACVDKPAGELARSGCSVFKAATQDLAAGAQCAASVLSSGAFMNQQIDFNGAGRDFCMATGEFTYALTSVLIPSKSPEQKAQQITSSLDRFIQTVRRSYQQADAIKRKFDNAVTLADAGVNVASKLNSLAGCGGAGGAAPPPPLAYTPPIASPSPPTLSQSPPPRPIAPNAPQGQAPFAPAMVPIPGANFEIGKYEVTMSEWVSVMGSRPEFETHTDPGCNDTCPVEFVSWNDIQVFLQRLNASSGKQFRLPTNTEWLLACHGGNPAQYCGGNDVESVAWYQGNNFDQSRFKKHPVGQKQPNAYGLHDMSGNVWEWLADCGDPSCQSRLRRGGDWGTPAVGVGVTAVQADAARMKWGGFRLARTLNPNVPTPAAPPAARPTAATPAPPAPLAPPAAPVAPVTRDAATTTINGKTLSAIRYQGPQGQGSFTAMPDGTWVQESALGRTTYVQHSRMAWAVHMIERHSTDDVLIDLQRMKVSRRVPGPSDLFDIVELRALDGSTGSQVAAPPNDNCGGYLEAPCLQGANQRCDEGLVPFYTYLDVGTTCNYTRRQIRQFQRGVPYPVRFPALNPSNPEHRKLLDAKVTISMVPPDFRGAKTRVVTVQAKGSDSIRDLIGVFAAKNKFSAAEAAQTTLSITRKATGFEHSEVALDEAQTVAAYGLRDGTRLAVGGKSCTGADCRFTLVFNLVKELSNVRVLGGSRQMKAGDTLGQFRSTLSPQATPVHITLLFEGKVLDDDSRTLASYGIGVDGDDIGFVGMVARKDAPPPVVERSFGCDQSWRWTTGAITVESDHRSCSPGDSTSHWTLRGVGARSLRATGVADDQSGWLALTIDEAGQQVSLGINRIRSTAPNSSEFRYGVASGSALIGTGSWESLQR